MTKLDGISSVVSRGVHTMTVQEIKPSISNSLKWLLDRDSGGWEEKKRKIKRFFFLQGSKQLTLLISFILH